MKLKNIIYKGSICLLLTFNGLLVVQGQYTTIISHGMRLNGNFDPDDWMMPMAESIRLQMINKGSTRIGIYNKTNGQFDWEEPTCDDCNNAILLFDWAEESNDNFEGFTEAAASALFASLSKYVMDEIIDVSYLHLIGHSRGTVVISELAERILASGMRNRYVSDFHITYLDAHDYGVFNTIGTDYDVNPWLPEEDWSGVMKWEGVDFVDAYFQTNPFYCGKPNLTGRAVEDAYNVLLDGTACNPDDPNDCCMSHSNIPGWYTTTTNAAIHPDGYKYSKVLGHDRPGPNDDYDPDPSIGHSPRVDFEDPRSGWIVNGSFDRASTQLLLIYGPGWDYHGGEPDGDFESSSDMVKLVPNRPLVSNRTFMPENAEYLMVDYSFGDDHEGDFLIQLIDENDILLQEEVLPIPDMPNADNRRTAMIPIGQLGGELLKVKLEYIRHWSIQRLKIDNVYLATCKEFRYFNNVELTTPYSKVFKANGISFSGENEITGDIAFQAPYFDFTGVESINTTGHVSISLSDACDETSIFPYHTAQLFATSETRKAPIKDLKPTEFFEEFFEAIPNPASDHIRILSHTQEYLTQVMLFDLDGGIITQSDILKTNQFELNLVELNIRDGIYLVVARNSKGRLSMKKVMIRNP